MSNRSRRGEFTCATWRAAAVASLVAIGCASGPTYEELESTLPPIAAGQGRIVLFLTGASEVPSFFPQLTVDGELAGELRTDTFFYVDRPAGPHVVGVHVKKVDASFGTQGATDPLEVTLAPGEKAYIEADATSATGMIVVTLTRVSPEEGERDLRTLHPAPQPAH